MCLADPAANLRQQLGPLWTPVRQLCQALGIRGACHGVLRNRHGDHGVLVDGSTLSASNTLFETVLGDDF